MQPANRPTSLVVIAVFHFIFGGLSVLCSLVGMATLGASDGGASMFGKPDARTEQLQKQMMSAVTSLPGYYPIQIGDKLVSLIYGGMLIAAGVGMLMVAPWARKLSIAYGGIALSWNILMALYGIFFLIPALEGAYRNAAAAARNAQERQVFELVAAGQKFGGCIGIALPLIYPFVVLLLMGLTSVREVFAAAEGQVPSSEFGPEGGLPPFGGPDDYRTR